MKRKVERKKKSMVPLPGSNWRMADDQNKITDAPGSPADSRDKTKQVGWICPVCGNGCAPWLSICTCATTTGAITIPAPPAWSRIIYCGNRPLDAK
jgi:hypothetical protein